MRSTASPLAVVCASTQSTDSTQASPPAVTAAKTLPGASVRERSMMLPPRTSHWNVAPNSDTSRWAIEWGCLKDAPHWLVLCCPRCRQPQHTVAVESWAIHDGWARATAGNHSATRNLFGLVRTGARRHAVYAGLCRPCVPRAPPAVKPVCSQCVRPLTEPRCTTCPALANVLDGNEIDNVCDGCGRLWHGCVCHSTLAFDPMLVTFA